MTSLNLDFLKTVKVILFDCDGVIMKGPEMIPGSIDALHKLSHRFQLGYVTNNSTKTVSSIYSSWSAHAFPRLAEDDIFVTSKSSALFLNKILSNQDSVFVVGAKALEDELEAYGINVSREKILDRSVKAVLVGLDTNLSYSKLSLALRYVNELGAVFIATNKDATIPNPGGYLECGAGVCVGALEYAVGRKADHVIGKPSPTMYEEAMKHYNVMPSEVLFVGDRVDTDIVGAAKLGCHTCLVLSGVTSEEEYKEVLEKNGVTPNLVFDNLKHLSIEVDSYFNE